MNAITRGTLAIYLLAIVALTGFAPASGRVGAVGAGTARAEGAMPLFAYYYIWFNAQAWKRAKIDYPAIGRYSSDEQTVMRRQIEAAKSAGIDGFIVSWKDTPTDDRRLRRLVAISVKEHFELAMIYEGLDFYRHPLPVAEVAAAFQMFRKTFAPSPAFFRVDGKPLTIWSGTWDYSRAAVAGVTSKVRSDLLVLNTEKSVRGFLRLADVTDGNAYYWSSVNPATDSHYAAKLVQMSRAIHRRGEYWIAPFAPGFDARLVGGRTVVSRDGTQTLRAEYATAIRSSPDMLGLISWNEYSENTYVEPSLKYHNRYLNALRQLRLTAVRRPSAGGSRTISGRESSGGYWPNVMLLAGFTVALVLSVGFIGYIRRHVSATGPISRPASRREKGRLRLPGSHLGGSHCHIMRCGTESCCRSQPY